MSEERFTIRYRYKLMGCYASGGGFEMSRWESEEPKAAEARYAADPNISQLVLRTEYRGVKRWKLFNREILKGAR